MVICFGGRLAWEMIGAAPSREWRPAGFARSHSRPPSLFVSGVSSEANRTRSDSLSKVNIRKLLFTLSGRQIHSSVWFAISLTNLHSLASAAANTGCYVTSTQELSLFALNRNLQPAPRFVARPRETEQEDKFFRPRDRSVLPPSACSLKNASQFEWKRTKVGRVQPSLGASLAGRQLAQK